MERMANCCASCGCLSTFTLNRVTFPWSSATTFSSTGANVWQGPHQSALKSTSSGSWLSSRVVLGDFLAIKKTGHWGRFVFIFEQVFLES